MFVIKQPIPPAPAADSTVNELKSMFEKQARVERFDLIQTFHAYKQEEGKSVSQYVLKMKGYGEQLERLGYVLLQDLSVGLISNGLTSNFAGFIRNSNMHNIWKTIGDRIQKANKKSQNAKGKGKAKGKVKDKSYIPKPKNPKPSAKEHPTKNDACHHYKEVGHCKRNCHVYLVELKKNKKQVGTTSFLGIMMTTKKIQEGRLKKFCVSGRQVNKGWSEFVLLYLVNAAGFCYCCLFMISAAKFKVDAVKGNIRI
ncbi:hypothetical protein Tco_1385767 [Tanacetum coccineum]